MCFYYIKSIYILLYHSVTVKFLRNRIHCIHLFSPAFILSHCVCACFTHQFSMCLALSLLLLGPGLQHGFLARATARDLAQACVNHLLQRATCLKHVSCELNRIEPPCATAWAPRVDNDLHTRQLLRPRLVCKTRSLHHSSRRCWAHTCLGMQQACCNCA